MKKRLAILFLPFLLLVTSCSDKKIEKFQLEGQYNIETALDLSVSDFDAKMDDKESFVFIVHSSMCNSCKAFKNYALDPVIKETQSIIYQVDSSEIFDSKHENKLKVKATPTLYVISKGSVATKEIYDNKKAMFTSKEGLQKFLEKYVYLPTLIQISEEDLDNKIKKNEDFVIYFGWKLCGDCKKLEERVLKKYLINNMKGKKLYYFETHEYINMGRPGSEGYEEKRQKWLNFTAKYNLNLYYRGGKVPTLQYYQAGVTSLENMLVYCNDAKDEEGKITEAFYEELIGQTLTQEDHLKYYDQKTIAFLDYYLQLV